MPVLQTRPATRSCCTSLHTRIRLVKLSSFHGVIVRVRSLSVACGGISTQRVTAPGESASAPRHIRRPNRYTKEPYQDMIWALYIRNRLENRGVRAPKTRHERVSYSLPWRSGLLCPLLSSSHLPHSTVLRRHGVPASIHRVGCRRRTRGRAGHCPGEGCSVPSWVYLRISHPSTHGARSCCCRRRAVPWQSRRA